MTSQGRIGIYINSAGRPGNVKTVKQFPDSWKDMVYIVVPHNQSNMYKKYNTWPVIALPPEVPPYLPSQRQWVMDNAPYEHVFFMDDDLEFQTRKREDTKLSRSEEVDMASMIMRVLHEHTRNKIPMVGISTRLGNNRIETDFADITRVTQCYSLSKKVFQDVGAKFAPFEPFLMEDFHIVLSWLKAGHRNRVIYNHAMSGSSSNAKGGVSRYRTFEGMHKTIDFLVKQHKGFCKKKMKKTKGGWDGFPVDEDGNVIRPDIIVQWKKAYASSRTKNKGINNFL